jgi:hypothetical protein
VVGDGMKKIVVLVALVITLISTVSCSNFLMEYDDKYESPESIDTVYITNTGSK